MPGHRCWNKLDNVDLFWFVVVLVVEKDFFAQVFNKRQVAFRFVGVGDSTCCIAHMHCDVVYFR